MRLSDERVVEFLAKSPLRSFAAMLDVLRYLDSQWVPEGVEYELFDPGLGDNPEGLPSLRVPLLGGIEANALFAFAKHAAEFHLLRRRTHPARGLAEDFGDLVTYYELTPAGHAMIQALRAIEGVVRAE